MKQTEKCEKCGKDKEMYYTLWCPACDKPKIENIQTLPLFKVLYHLEAIGHEGIKERVMDAFSDDIRNDSFFSMAFPESGGMTEEEGIKEWGYVYPDLMIIKKAFNIGDSILMWVSW